MNRDAFLRDLRPYCRKNGLAFSWDASHGKGGHGRVKVGDKFTTVQSDVSRGVRETILKQLGLPKDAI